MTFDQISASDFVEDHNTIQSPAETGSGLPHCHSYPDWGRRFAISRHLARNTNGTWDDNLGLGKHD